MAEAPNIELILSRLLAARKYGPGRTIQLPETEIHRLCHRATEILMSEPSLLEVPPPIKVCGDIHGQYHDLLRLFELGGFPPKANYLFLGDYVDRGRQSVETMCLLLAYKIKYPQNFFILRGNHECARINRKHGFFEECERRYSIRLWRSFVEVFDRMPPAAIIGGKIFCCHGGLSPDLESMDQIRKIQRPTDVPEEGLLCDLLWSDPDKKTIGWDSNLTRGLSYTFGPEIVEQFLADHNFQLIFRAHKMPKSGFEFFAQGRLVTIFSAPKYCGDHDNNGALMSVDENLNFKIQILRPLTETHISRKLKKQQPLQENLISELLEGQN